jgi:hypothetical protein
MSHVLIAFDVLFGLRPMHVEFLGILVEQEY